jgi:hypothetical protein
MAIRYRQRDLLMLLILLTQPRATRAAGAKAQHVLSAVGFIYDVKKGPFWEHSPILFDISGIRAGWAKINKVGGVL